ncbi:MAG: HAD family hydrolase [Nitriliruptoraceae bacterium]
MADLHHPPTAVLLDLDGTLVDSGHLWHRAYRAWAASAGVHLPPDWWAAVVGASLPGSIRTLAPDHTDAEVTTDIEVVVTEAAAALSAEPAGSATLVTWRPGARELLAALDAAGVATAVVTTTPRRVLDAIDEHLGLDVLVTVAGDEVTRGKPDPEGYLRAAAALEVDPGGCVVIEDSPTGVAAAEAARMRLLVVAGEVPVPAGPTRRVVPSLTGVDLGVLAALRPPGPPPA